MTTIGYTHPPSRASRDSQPSGLPSQPSQAPLLAPLPSPYLPHTFPTPLPQWWKSCTGMRVTCQHSKVSACFDIASQLLLHRWFLCSRPHPRVQVPPTAPTRSASFPFFHFLFHSSPCVPLFLFHMRFLSSKPGEAEAARRTAPRNQLAITLCSEWKWKPKCALETLNARLACGFPASWIERGSSVHPLGKLRIGFCDKVRSATSQARLKSSRLREPLVVLMSCSATCAWPMDWCEH